jgi:hypothetical protein
MRARLGVVGYTAQVARIYGMVARGATYPYSSVQQDARNRRRYGARSAPLLPPVPPITWSKRLNPWKW